MTDKTMYVPLFPGAATPEGKARINKAVEAMDDNAASCREILNEVVRNLRAHDCYHKLDYDLRQRIGEAIYNWHRCSEELRNAVSGRNPE